MKKIKFLFLACLVIAFAIANIIAQKQSFSLETTCNLFNLESLAGCESASGYDMSSYCMSSPGNKCYYSDFTASNCTSNRV